MLIDGSDLEGKDEPRKEGGSKWTIEHIRSCQQLLLNAHSGSC